MSALIATSPGSNVGAFQSPSATPSVDVVIPHRGSADNLWFTLQSLRSALESSSPPLDWRFLVCWNGFDTSQPTSYISKLLDDLKAEGRLELVTTTEPLSPPAARHRGAQLGSGQFIFFFDSHVLVPPDYFVRALEQMARLSIDVLHSAWTHFSERNFHYALGPQALSDFHMVTTPAADKPYRCAVGAHGAFVVRRGVWRALGGYWSLFRSWGGEEVSFNLSAWMQSYECWFDPELVHWHLPSSDRGYERLSRAMAANNLVVALTLGGRRQAERDYRYLRRHPLLHSFVDRQLLDDVVTYCGDFPEKMQSRFIRSLDEQLAWFRANQVAC